MTVLGYMRVSCEDQNAELQHWALSDAGCERIHADLGVSAIAKKRPGFEKALAELETGDTMVVWKIDRAFRSLRMAIDTLEDLNARGIAFRSLTEHIDTSSPMGHAMYQIQNVFAELERKLISERTKAGLAAAKRRGVRLGRRPKLSDEKVMWARRLLSQDPSRKRTQIAEILGVSPRTLRRALTTDRS